jgi:uncharacterized flavoprotein (TIGR03862 family)
MIPPVRVGVFGAGPAGLAAAEVLVGAGADVTLFERMPSAGRKFLMAGRGGLNLTHSEPLEAFLARYRPLPPALQAAIVAFPPDRLRTHADGLGAATFVGSSGRVFPKAMKASPLLRAMLERLAAGGARLVTRAELLDLEPGPAAVVRTADGEARFAFDAILLALGGASWPRLGSDGGWRAMLEARGVAVAPLRPSNMGVVVPWTLHFAGRFAGAPLKPAALSIEGRRIRGEAVVTRRGLEGGAVYALSEAIRTALDRDGVAPIVVDLRPETPHDALAERLAAARRGASTADMLRRAGLGPVAVSLLREAAIREGVAPPRDPAALARAVKAVTLPVVATEGLERAISSAGGVRFAAVDDRFMLRRLPGVFVAGEMLDWDAPTGGYLLQATFSTAIAAARGILEHLGEARTPSGAAADPP